MRGLMGLSDLEKQCIKRLESQLGETFKWSHKTGMCFHDADIFHRIAQKNNIQKMRGGRNISFAIYVYDLVDLPEDDSPTHLTISSDESTSDTFKSKYGGQYTFK